MKYSTESVEASGRKCWSDLSAKRRHSRDCLGATDKLGQGVLCEEVDSRLCSDW